MRFALVLLALVTVAACGGHRMTRAPVRATDASTSTACAPYVSGCGCAFMCVSGMRSGAADDATKWQVTPDGGASRVGAAVFERWCFDEEGHGYVATKAPAKARRCMDVFYDESAEHHACQPTTAFLGCHLDGPRCVR